MPIIAGSRWMSYRFEDFLLLAAIAAIPAKLPAMAIGATEIPVWIKSSVCTSAAGGSAAGSGAGSEAAGAGAIGSSLYSAVTVMSSVTLSNALSHPMNS